MHVPWNPTLCITQLHHSPLGISDSDDDEEGPSGGANARTLYSPHGAFLWSACALDPFFFVLPGFMKLVQCAYVLAHSDGLWQRVIYIEPRSNSI